MSKCLWDERDDHAEGVGDHVGDVERWLQAVISLREQRRLDSHESEEERHRHEETAFLELR